MPAGDRGRRGGDRPPGRLGSTRARARLARACGTSDGRARARAARSRPLERRAVGRFVAELRHRDEHVDDRLGGESRHRCRADVLNPQSGGSSAEPIRSRSASKRRGPQGRSRRSRPRGARGRRSARCRGMRRAALRALGPVSQAGATGAGALGSARVAAGPDVLHRSLQGAARAAGDADPDYRRRPRDRRGVGEAAARTR